MENQKKAEWLIAQVFYNTVLHVEGQLWDHISFLRTGERYLCDISEAQHPNLRTTLNNILQHTWKARRGQETSWMERRRAVLPEGFHMLCRVKPTTPMIATGSQKGQTGSGHCFRAIQDTANSSFKCFGLTYNKIAYIFFFTCRILDKHVACVAHHADMYFNWLTDLEGVIIGLAYCAMHLLISAFLF